jgi:RNA polymerase sigma factor (sigma-70 family)
VVVEISAVAIPADRDAAVTLLFRIHGARLVGFARLLVGDSAHAEDLVQDAFVGLWRRWSHLRDSDAALAYLHASVSNGARRGGRGARLIQRLIGAGHEPDEVPDPALSSIANEESRRLIEAIRQLPQRQRAGR